MSGGFDASGALPHGDIPLSARKATVPAVLVALEDPQTGLVWIVEFEALQPAGES